MGKLLIAGIDPGTNSGYAVLDLQGNLIVLGSARNWSVNQLIRKIVAYGKICVVATDVTPCPGHIRKIAASVGAKIIEPEYNLQFLEKIKIVDEFLKTQAKFVKINNQHEKDALSAALCGYKKMMPLIKKIKDHLEQHDKVYLTELIHEKVLIDKIAIVKALRQCC
ncbi:DUF460 domain-containing protein [Candidatus Woesearchaeota archaeon]|nr:DUF460 domain-containing protein [Candidatus Woesearchaeota archaeon]